MTGGKKVWYFADGYLPENTAEVLIDIYYSDREPERNIAVTVPPERIISLRMDQPEDLAGAVVPPLTQYAVRIRSTIPIVCQFGRLDTTQNAMSYYVGIGYAE